MKGNRYPLFKATTTPQEVVVIDGPYVIFSEIQGFVPAIDITVKKAEGGYCEATWIINPMSVGKVLLAPWTSRQDEILGHSLQGFKLMVSRVAEGRMAPYKVEVISDTV